MGSLTINTSREAGELVHKLGAQRTQVWYPASIWQLSTTYNFNPEEFSILSCNLEALGISMTHIYMHAVHAGKVLIRIGYYSKNNTNVL